MPHDPIRPTALLLAALALTACTSPAPEQPASTSPTAAAKSAAKGFTYPAPPPVDHKDTYHGEAVADPYRWLEETDSAQSKAWVEGENKLTFGYLDQIPERSGIKARLTSLWNY